LGRTLRSLAYITLVGVGLAVYNSYSLRRDVGIATGPQGDAQHEFFASAATRPDIALFYKGLTHAQRISMANNIGHYDDAKLAPLIGTLLGSFDTEARTALTESLTALGRTHPEAVALQLKQAGSLQQFAIATSLRAIGNSDLPAVGAQLAVADARPHAVAYMVAAGHDAVPVLMPYLDHKTADVRLAAADALGKLGAREAVPKLVGLYEDSKGDEHFGYLSAIGGIGAPETEALLSRVVADVETSTPRRAQAFLGLGRIASDTSIATLWSFAKDDDVQIREAVIAGLQLAGPTTLATAPNSALGLKVASGLKVQAATDYIDQKLREPDDISDAARAASNRPELVMSLTHAVIEHPDGADVDLLMRALSSTPAGISELKQFTRDPNLGGFAMRRLRLIGVQG